MRCLYIILGILNYSIAAHAQPSPLYSISSEFEAVNAFLEHYNDLYDYTEILVDPSGEWSYKEVLKKSDQFQQNTTRIDANRDKVYWAKIYLRAVESGKHLFSVGKVYFDHGLVDIYYERGDSLYHQRSGFKRRPAEKAVRRSGSYFWVDLLADTVQTIYIRIDNRIYPRNWPGKRNPVSIFHIDSTSPGGLTGGYRLRDLMGEMPDEGVGKTASPKEVQIGWYFEFYPDAECQLSLDEVRRNWDHQSYFRGFKPYDFDLGACHWARLIVINPQLFAQTRTFAYSTGRWDRIEYYHPDSSGNYVKHQTFPNRQDQKAFSFSVAAQDTMSVYIKYPPRANGYAYNGSVTDISPVYLLDQQQNIRYKYFLAGAVIFFMIYFFLQLVFNWELLLFSYFLIVLGLAPSLLAYMDSAQLFRYTQTIYNLPTVWHLSVLSAGEMLAHIGALLFTAIVLNLKEHFPPYAKLIKYLILVALAIGLFDFVADIWFGNDRNDLSINLWRFSTSIQNTYGVLLGIFILFIGLKAYFSGISLSGNFLIALFPLILFVLYDGIVEPLFSPDWPYSEIVIASVLLSIMLYGVLAGARINLIKKEEHETARRQMQLQNELLQLESKALRAQMNPHFIFNCLNSIKSLIQEGEHKRAIHYLTQFAGFIRNVLHYSEEKQISLEQEIEISRLYLEMEKLRFENSFTYQIETDPGVDTSFIRVPPMILQPFLENAIWHGLLHKKGERLLKLEVRAEGEFVKCVVDDNGVGRMQASVWQNSPHAEHRSFGTKLTQDRLKINKELFDHKFRVDIIDKMVNGTAAGTKVELSLEN